MNIKKIAAIIVFVVLLTLVVLYFFVFKDRIIGTNGQNNTIDVNREDEYSMTTQQMSVQLKDARLSDFDLDGIVDDAEKGLGTDPQKADTDGDGILDNDEIKIYKTNPLKADTDEDGKSDGYEARRNQDPLKNN